MPQGALVIKRITWLLGRRVRQIIYVIGGYYKNGLQTRRYMGCCRGPKL